MKERQLGETHIDKSFKVLVQVSQIVLSLLVLGDQGLLALEKLLTSLFELLSFRMFMVDASDHKLMFVGVLMFRV